MRTSIVLALLGLLAVACTASGPAPLTQPEPPAGQRVELRWTVGSLSGNATLDSRLAHAPVYLGPYRLELRRGRLRLDGRDLGPARRGVIIAKGASLDDLCPQLSTLLGSMGKDARKLWFTQISPTAPNTRRGTRSLARWRRRIRRWLLVYTSLSCPISGGTLDWTLPTKLAETVKRLEAPLEPYPREAKAQQLGSLETELRALEWLQLATRLTLHGTFGRPTPAPLIPVYEGRTYLERAKRYKGYALAALARSIRFTKDETRRQRQRLLEALLMKVPLAYPLGLEVLTVSAPSIRRSEGRLGVMRVGHEVVPLIKHLGSARTLLLAAPCDKLKERWRRRLGHLSLIAHAQGGKVAIVATKRCSMPADARALWWPERATLAKLGVTQEPTWLLLDARGAVLLRRPYRDLVGDFGELRPKLVATPTPALPSAIRTTLRTISEDLEAGKRSAARDRIETIRGRHAHHPDVLRLRLEAYCCERRYGLVYLERDRYAARYGHLAAFLLVDEAMKSLDERHQRR